VVQNEPTADRRPDTPTAEPAPAPPKATAEEKPPAPGPAPAEVEATPPAPEKPAVPAKAPEKAADPAPAPAPRPADGAAAPLAELTRDEDRRYWGRWQMVGLEKGLKENWFVHPQDDALAVEIEYLDGSDKVVGKGVGTAAKADKKQLTFVLKYTEPP